MVGVGWGVRAQAEAEAELFGRDEEPELNWRIVTVRRPIVVLPKCELARD